MLMKKQLTRRGFVAGSAIGAGTLAGCAASQESQGSDGQSEPKTTASSSRLAIVHTNDTHGYDNLTDENLGMAAVAQLRNDWEEKGYEALVLDAGDAAQGNVLVNCSSGTAAIEFMNEVGYDAMAVGNHEFDFGWDKIEGFQQMATFPLLSANVVVEATGKLLVEPSTTLELKDGTKVGVFGLTTPSTSTSANPLDVQGLKFLGGQDMFDRAQEQVDALRADGCGLVICLAHLGEDESVEPNRAQDLVANVSGIDLVINGHDHLEENQTFEDPDGKSVLVVETGCYTHAVGVVTWENGEFAAQLEKSGDYEGQDAEVAAAVQKVQDEVDEKLSQIISTTTFVLNGERNPGVRTNETNLGDFVADAMLWKASLSGEDTPGVALVNGGAIRASIPVGDISIESILNVLPFVNYLFTLQVTGAQLLESLEASTATTPEEMGAFPQVSGLKWTLDTTVPYEKGDKYPDSTYYAPAKPGSRVTIEEVAGAPFDPDATYTVAASDYLCAGGDTYYVLAEAAKTSMKGVGCLIYEAVQNYVSDVYPGGIGEEYTDPQGRITIKS